MSKVRLYRPRESSFVPARSLVSLLSQQAWFDGGSRSPASSSLLLFLPSDRQSDAERGKRGASERRRVIIGIYARLRPAPRLPDPASNEAIARNRPGSQFVPNCRLLERARARARVFLSATTPTLAEKQNRTRDKAQTPVTSLLSIIIIIITKLSRQSISAS